MGRRGFPAGGARLRRSFVRYMIYPPRSKRGIPKYSPALLMPAKPENLRRKGIQAKQ